MKTTKVLSFAGAMFAIIGMATFPLAHADYDRYEYGNEGCTPGFYKANYAKNDSDMYPPGFTGDTLVTTLGITNTNGLDLTGMTIIDALQLKGGPELADKESILVRAGVAAMLNALHPEVNYTLAPGQVLMFLNGVLALDNPDAAIALATAFDNDNNGEDGCPLNNSGKPRG